METTIPTTPPFIATTVTLDSDETFSVSKADWTCWSFSGGEMARQFPGWWKRTDTDVARTDGFELLHVETRSTMVLSYKEKTMTLSDRTLPIKSYTRGSLLTVIPDTIKCKLYRDGLGGDTSTYYGAIYVKLDGHIRKIWEVSSLKMKKEDKENLRGGAYFYNVPSSSKISFITDIREQDPISDDELPLIDYDVLENYSKTITLPNQNDFLQERIQTYTLDIASELSVDVTVRWVRNEPLTDTPPTVTITTPFGDG